MIPPLNQNRSYNLIEKDLVNEIRSGNKAKFEVLYKKYAAALFGIISRIVKFEDVAEHVLQETFIEIWQSIDQYDATKLRLFTWMARIARKRSYRQTP